MSKGSPILTVRVPPLILRQIDEAISRHHEFGKGEPLGRSTWLFQAIKEKLAKMERSRSGRWRKNTPANTTNPKEMQP